MIKSGEKLDLTSHMNHVKLIMNKREEKRKKKMEVKKIISMFPPKVQRCISCVVEGNASHWLTVVPTSADSFDFCPTQFRDALYLRYGKEIISMPALCDGCGRM